MIDNDYCRGVKRREPRGPERSNWRGVRLRGWFLTRFGICSPAGMRGRVVREGVVVADESGMTNVVDAERDRENS